MAGYHRMKLFSLFFMLMFAVCVFAQPSMQLVDANEPILQDSLVTDSLSKISLANDVDTNTIVNTNKVESVDAEIEETPDLNVSKKSEPLLREYCYSCNVYDVMPYTPYGFTVEAAYAGPTVLSLQLWGYRNFFIKHKVLVGVPLIAADIDFDGWKVSDEGILAAIFFFSSFGNDSHFLIWLYYLLFGDTYYPLTGDDGIGLFETHHIVDYLLYDLSNDKPWEFGFSEAMGIRFVYAGGRRDGARYLDLGANVRLTNKAFRFGIFVQLGLAGTHK